MSNFYSIDIKHVFRYGGIGIKIIGALNTSTSALKGVLTRNTAMDSYVPNENGPIFLRSDKQGLRG